jgi:hypothetical protein
MAAAAPLVDKKKPQQISKLVAFSTSGLGGILGWICVHPVRCPATDLVGPRPKPRASICPALRVVIAAAACAVQYDCNAHEPREYVGRRTKKHAICFIRPDVRRPRSDGIFAPRAYI